ncbi:sugar transferase [Candidatus Magnetomonas plexicatena]|uniref:sugar transferase n=1 Tax=Candidatus Magnetomonas plexicatena TaxID=2552947 RepID=UPI001C76A070|nr:sugar transferase [Nitrospirales bacterium LBB_01]
MAQNSFRIVPIKAMVLACGDVLLIALSLFLAVYLRMDQFLNPTYFLKALIISTVVHLFCFYVLNLYSTHELSTGQRYTLRVVSAVLLASAVNAVLFYIIPFWHRGIFILNAAFVFTFISGWRALFRAIIEKTKRKIRLVIIGAGKNGEILAEKIRENPNFEFLGFIDDNMTSNAIGTTAHLKSLVHEDKLDRIVIASDLTHTAETFAAIVEAKFKGIEIYDMPQMYEELTTMMPVFSLDDIWLSYASFYGINNNIYNAKLKHIADKIISVVILIISLPIGALTAVLIKLDSRGPVFFTQDRVGFNGQIFKIIKFRSMKVDAETNGAVWASSNDPRVTRVGKFIRKFRIDELPQLINVLRGEMSFIGPRPERPDFVQGFNISIPYYSLRHSVRPGITGWAQIKYRYGASYDDTVIKLQYDLFYIKRLSSMLDLLIMFETVKTVLFGKGAR